MITESNEIPNVVYWQAANLIILFGPLIYYGKNTILKFFVGRQELYLEHSKKTAAVREAAEKQLLDIKHKIQELELTESDVLKQAELQAEQLRLQILTEAQLASKRIMDEALASVTAELEKAKRELKSSVAKESLEVAKTTLTKDLGSTEQTRLQDQFVKHVEGLA